MSSVVGDSKSQSYKSGEYINKNKTHLPNVNFNFMIYKQIVFRCATSSESDLVQDTGSVKGF